MKFFKILYKLRIYLLIIFIIDILLSVLATLISIKIYNTSWWLPVLFVFFSTLMVIVLDGITAALTHKLPKKLADPYRFKEHKWEKKFFNFIKIKKWKDHIPEIGALTVDFAKDKMGDVQDSSYLYYFLIEVGYAEIDHTVSMLVGFLIIFMIPLRYALFIGLPIGLVNVVFNLLSGLIQRYNRPKLLKVYERALKKEERESLSEQ